MACLNTFPARCERSILALRPVDRGAFGPAKPGGGRFPNDGKGSRKTGAGGNEFLMASAVLGAARWLHRRGLIGVHGFRVALTLAERLSAQGIAKWRAARCFDAPKAHKGP
ncbi:MAG TPA: hypothetical protein VGH03_08365 [Caulobacteraceae bacterium]|jgi:hypothetical protein